MIARQAGGTVHGADKMQRGGERGKLGSAELRPLNLFIK